MATRRGLVIGASGFVGSHVTRQLVGRGDDVRVLVRPTSSTVAFDDLPVDVRRAELTDDAALVDAMADREVVFHCAVDARAWLRDPAPLFRANVEGLRHVLEAAVSSRVERFVYTSTVGTCAVRPGPPVTEDEPCNWAHLGGPYIRARLQGEEMVLAYARDRGLPAVVMCVATTVGPRDHRPTPHGRLIDEASRGRIPVYVRGAGLEMVGIEDAARALLLAAERGRVGERYIVSERLVPVQELFVMAARAGGVRPPRVGLPLSLMKAVGALGPVLALLLRRDLSLTPATVRMMHIWTPLDHGKAERELGWRPAPLEESVRGAVAFAREQDRRAGSHGPSASSSGTVTKP